MPINMAHILMCPPDYYGIEYEINPWMNRERQADHALAVEQWKSLQSILGEVGAQISLLQPQEGLPDLVFTANAALIYRRKCILSNFRHPQRQGEKPVNDAWFRDQGFEVEELPENLFFEGAGDALFCGDTLFAGYQIRSHAVGHQAIGARLSHRVIPLPLVDSYFYHLDTCFCPVNEDTAIYFPNAFDEYGQRAVQEHVPHLIEVSADEAREFACNAVVVGKTVVTNTGCPHLHQQLESAGFQTRETPLSEFVKAGGSAKCLTLRLDGEEAASWKR
jgi:N-dimethylarginine dimethylaminohydrolase